MCRASSARAADLVDRIHGRQRSRRFEGGGADRHPSRSRSSSTEDDADGVSILGEKLSVVRVDGADNFTAPGRPIAVISNVMLEYRPAPPREAGAGQTPVSGRPERLSIIVPVYNEARTVRAVIDRLLTIDLPVPREILVVDDGSTDGTGEVLDRRRRRRAWRSPSSACRRTAGRGARFALGWRGPRERSSRSRTRTSSSTPRNWRRWCSRSSAARASVVYGSRFLDGTARAPRMTIAGNRMLTAATNVLYGSAITDMETCYKIMRADVAHSLKLTASRFDIEPEITARLLRGGHRIHELPVRFAPRSRAEGKKIRWRDGVRALQVLLIERFR